MGTAAVGTARAAASPSSRRLVAGFAPPLSMTASVPIGLPRRLKELTPPEVAAILASDPRLLVPVGANDPHGAHLPFGCDTIIVEHLADDLSARFGVLRAPTVEYGVNGGVPTALPGAAGVRKKTLHRLLNDLVAAWEDCGVEELILLTAHAFDPHQEALATVITARARVRVVDLFAIQVADLLEGQLEPMHGDEVDTSIMLHLAPELVRLDAAEDYMVERGVLRRFRRTGGKVARGVTGSLGRPSLASAEKGRLLYERIRDRVGERVLRAPAPID